MTGQMRMKAAAVTAAAAIAIGASPTSYAAERGEATATNTAR